MIDWREEASRRAGLQPVGKRPLHAASWEEAVEALVVPETWFFRDAEPFLCLAEFARRGPRPLRVLSAPCSTGEEPYSIAIALLEAGLRPSEFVIDALDISERALSAARRAVFGRSSFRQPRPDLATRYFYPAEDGLALDPAIAALPRFRRANLLEAGEPCGSYHVIFCRNLLIYLHDVARQSLIAAMLGVLARNGILFAGHSELMLFLEHGMEKAPHPRAFACRRPVPRPNVEAPPPRPRPHTAPPKPQPRRVPPPPDPAPAPTLADARALADRGDLDQAAEICAHLLEGGPSAEGYYLLGLIHQTNDRLADAEELFRRALYLDPRHPDALLHMSLLYEAKGDLERSLLFRERARREERP